MTGPITDVDVVAVLAAHMVDMGVAQTTKEAAIEGEVEAATITTATTTNYRAVARANATACRRYSATTVPTATTD